jgi:hypothetical protein
MSAGKQPVYLTKIRGASGLGGALAVGGGTPDSPGPLVKHCAYSVIDGAATLTTANCHGVVEMDADGSPVNLTMATVASIAAAFPEWESGCAIDLHVVNTGGETITMAVGTGFTLVGTATMATATSAHWKLIRTGASAANLVRVV